MVLPKGVQRPGKRDIEECLGRVKVSPHCPNTNPKTLQFSKQLKPHIVPPILVLIHNTWKINIVMFTYPQNRNFIIIINLMIEGTTPPCLLTVKLAAGKAGQSSAMASTKVIFSFLFLS